MFVATAILFPLPSASGHAVIFVGKVGQHELAGHGDGDAGVMHLPSSYVGVVQTYTMLIRNERNISTTGFQIIIPQGMQLISAEDVEGWKLTTHRCGGAERCAAALIWNGSSIPGGEEIPVFFTVRNPPDIFVYYFVVVQIYEGGEQDVWRPWIQIVSSTSIAGVEFSAIAAIVIIIALALPFLELSLARIKGKPS